MPRFTSERMTISPFASSHSAFIIGSRCIAMRHAFATTSSGVTLMSLSSRMPCSSRTNSIVRVMSTVRNSVTCGAVNALLTMACAVTLRTPLIGMRSSLRPAGAGAAAVGLSGRTDGALAAAFATVSALGAGGALDATVGVDIAAGAFEPPAFFTSSRVTTPSSREGSTVSMSTPCCFANPRVAGAASVPPPDAPPPAPRPRRARRVELDGVGP